MIYEEKNTDWQIIPEKIPKNEYNEAMAGIAQNVELFYGLQEETKAISHDIEELLGYIIKSQKRRVKDKIKAIFATSVLRFGSKFFIMADLSYRKMGLLPEDLKKIQVKDQNENLTAGSMACWPLNNTYGISLEYLDINNRFYSNIVKISKENKNEATIQQLIVKKKHGYLFQDSDTKYYWYFNIKNKEFYKCNFQNKQEGEYYLKNMETTFEDRLKKYETTDNFPPESLNYKEL